MDDHQVFYATDESLDSTPETNKFFKNNNLKKYLDQAFLRLMLSAPPKA